MKPAISYYPLPRPIFGKCHSLLTLYLTTFFCFTLSRDMIRHVYDRIHPRILPKSRISEQVVCR